MPHAVQATTWNPLLALESAAVFMSSARATIRDVFAACITCSDIALNSDFCFVHLRQDGGIILCCSLVASS